MGGGREGKGGVTGAASFPQIENNRNNLPRECWVYVGAGRELIEFLTGAKKGVPAATNGLNSITGIVCVYKHI